MSEFVQHIINGLASGTIYALVALGYTMVYGVLKLINFAHGDVMMVGVYVGYATSRQLERSTSQSFLGVTLVFLVAMAACAALGFLIERFAYRPLREKPKLTALITAIGVSFFLSYSFQVETRVGDITILPGAAPKAFPEIIKPTEWLVISDGTGPSERFTLTVTPTSCAPCGQCGVDDRCLPLDAAALESAPMGPLDRQQCIAALTAPVEPARCHRGDRDIVLWNWQIISISIAAALMAALQYLVFKTRFGMAMRAVSFDHRTAGLMGIPVDRVIAFTFMLGSALAAGAGILYAIKDTLVQPLMGVTLGLKAFVAAVIGGIGHVPGAVVGALALGLVEEFVVGYGSSTWRDAVAFGFLILVLLVKPEGIFGRNIAEKV
ncbi:MAG: branched-chain amino acid ABC transporter permease [Deltaproteobacteria bacterium]|nr:branched-chain amino acid ABC transporter permease [Deltaproteobacteria bacterium]